MTREPVDPRVIEQIGCSAPVTWYSGRQLAFEDVERKIMAGRRIHIGIKRCCTEGIRKLLLSPDRLLPWPFPTWREREIEKSVVQRKVRVQVRIVIQKSTPSLLHPFKFTSKPGLMFRFRI